VHARVQATEMAKMVDGVLAGVTADATDSDDVPASVVTRRPTSFASARAPGATASSVRAHTPLPIAPPRVDVPAPTGEQLRDLTDDEMRAKCPRNVTLVRDVATAGACDRVLVCRACYARATFVTLQLCARVLSLRFTVTVRHRARCRTASRTVTLRGRRASSVSCVRH
jgi:hypothetical protein